MGFRQGQDEFKHELTLVTRRNVLRRAAPRNRKLLISRNSWLLSTDSGKNDQTNQPNRPIKEILGLPLAPRFRELLSQL
jgi:hypothetical protein